MGFPITYNEENVGVIVLYSNTTEALNGIENQMIYDFTGQVGIAIQNARLFNQIEEMATVDGLTGAYSRTHFMELCDAAIEEHSSTNKILSLIMLDIDYFKKINDTYGHLAGDKVLKELVSTIKEELNETSIIGRYGGEEFLILLKETDLETALNIAEKLRTRVESMQVRISKECCVKITSSIGVVSYNKNFENISQLIEKADEALYISKENGRNQVRAVLARSY
ncbi:Diguanylate cyclase DgcM [bioreactor metagenome]|uniref:Diguanylate cyclase DgcM n=1 Tax=bioreactor metagenome TaxID=1076179 RepID=A0A645FWZ1_9ZZZZ